MISFFQLPLNEEIMEALVELEIDYVFQPIFHRGGKEIYAYEALMRPKHKTVLELIDEYKKQGQLHVLEVATFFGAAMAYKERGYKEYVCINSFPSECFTDEENEVFNEYFGTYMDRGIIEILEYPEVPEEILRKKKEIFQKKGYSIALDDFGTGRNDMSAVDLFTPNIVKIDRSLIAGIDKDKEKQKQCRKYIKIFHERGMKVLAEGVETEEEFLFLDHAGVDLLQGYYLGRPE